MNKADQYFKQTLHEILYNGTSTEGHKVRPKWADGTPAHTKYINQMVYKYNIERGEYPISTFRPLAWKSAIREIMVIYQDQLNTREGFENKKVFWWENWMNEQGNIGRAYPYNLESHRDNEQVREIIKVKKRIFDSSIGKPIDEKIKEIKKYKSEEIMCKKYILIEKDKEKRKFKVQNINTGEEQWISKNAYNKLENGEDLGRGNPFKYNRNFYGLGYEGNLANVLNYSEREIKILRKKWINMIKRVNTYDTYKNVFISTRWQSLEHFLEDIRYIPQFHLAKEQNFKDWELDKDYFGSNCYSKESCVFLKKKENVMYSDIKNLSILIKPNGEQETFLSLMDACNKYNLNYGNLYSTTNGKRNHCHNYKAIFKDFEEGYVYRYELSRNQINNLLYDIKNKPYERRHIVSFWNWQNIDKKELVECAYETVWNVRDGYLDMTLHQRSSDFCTAWAINEFQYFALMLMICSEVNLKPGVFMHVVENVHIYNRHFENAKKLLDRIPNSNPELLLNSKDKGFYNFTIDDFELKNFEAAGDQLKFELAI